MLITCHSIKGSSDHRLRNHCNTELNSSARSCSTLVLICKHGCLRPAGGDRTKTCDVLSCLVHLVQIYISQLIWSSIKGALVGFFRSARHCGFSLVGLMLQPDVLLPARLLVLHSTHTCSFSSYHNKLFLLSISVQFLMQFHYATGLRPSPSWWASRSPVPQWQLYQI